MERMVGPNPPELEQALRALGGRRAEQSRSGFRGVVGILPSGNPGEGLAHPSVKQWSWGGFLAGPIWAWFHGMFDVALLTLLLCWLFPLPNLLLGLYGGQMAWRVRPYADYDEFERHQRAWALGGLLLFVATLVGLVAGLVLWQPAPPS